MSNTLKNNAWYPALLRTTIDDIEVVFWYQNGLFHIGGTVFYRDDLINYTQDDFSWIGEELDIEWNNKEE